MEEKYFKRRVSQDNIKEDEDFSLVPFDKKENSLEVVPNLNLTSSKEELVERIKTTNSVDELKDLTNLFGVALTKEEIIRASKESDLVNKIVDQVGKRIEERSDTLPSSDLLELWKVMQSNIDKSRKSVNEDMDKAVTTIAPTEVTINIGTTSELSRESRDKVLDFMKTLFNNVRNEQENATVIEQEEIDLTKEESNDGND